MHAERYRTTNLNRLESPRSVDIEEHGPERSQQTKRNRASLLVLSLSFLLFGFGSSYSQSYYSHVSQDGYAISKLVTDTVINSGRIFEYSITFSIPANATNVTVSDQLPPGLQFVSSAYSVGQSCSPGATIPSTVSAPVVNSQGGTYSIFIPNAGSCGATGSISLFVRFPCGVTCNGASVRNQACISYLGSPGEKKLCTGFVSTMARAINPWHVVKSVVNKANQGGTCPNAVNDSVITYKIQVYKDPGTEGQMSLWNGIVTDILPTGAYLKPGSSTCGMTTSGQTVSWSNINLGACTYYSSATCTFDVVYPRSIFQVGTTVNNTARLIGLLGDSTTDCGSFVDSSTVCSEFKAVTSGALTKKVLTNGQPGCTGTYTLLICNNGNQPLNGVNVADTLPALTYGSVTTQNMPSGWTASIIGGALYVFSNGTPLAVGGCVTVTVPFTIPVGTPPGVVTNCATYTATGDTTRRVCVPITVVDPAPKLCLNKSICNEQPYYMPGETFTYRLRIVNIGGEDLVGGTITDLLDDNLSFVPSSVRAYQNNVPGDIACGQTTDAWGSGVTTTAPSGGNNTVTFDLPTIPFNCDGAVTCGQSGSTVPYFVIEFDVRISDSTVLGSLPNLFTVSGDSVAPVSSNKEWVLVSALTRYWIEKEVRKVGSPTYGTSASVNPGDNVEYRMRLGIPTNTPQFAALRHVSFIDELPRDNNLSDGFLKMCGNRGSLFDLTAQSFTSNSYHPATGYRESAGIDYPSISTWGSASPFPPLTMPLFVAGCSAMLPGSTWVPTMNSGDKNVGFYFSPYAFTHLSSPVATVELTAKVSSTALPGDTACNTFIAGAAVRRIISGVVKDVPIIEMESTPVCIKIDSSCTTVIDEEISCRVDAQGNVVYDYCVTMENTSSLYAYSSPPWLSGPAGVTFIPNPDYRNFLTHPLIFPVPPGGTFTHCFQIIGGDAGDMIVMHDTINQFNPQNPTECVKCIVADSIELPDCPVPVDCCPVDFTHAFSQASLSLDNFGNGSITGLLNTGPQLMQSVKVTLVSAYIRNVPVVGEITSGNLGGSAGSVTPMHEVSFGTWAPCKDLTTNAPFSIGLKLPPHSCPPDILTTIDCPELDKVCLRFQFVDCECRTCDTIICLTTTRSRPIIWHRFPSRRFRGMEEEKSPQSQAAPGDAVLSGIILSDTNGRLDIVFPEPLDASDITFESIAIDPVDSTTYINNAVNDGGDIFFGAGGNGYGSFSAKPGEEMSISLSYNDLGGVNAVEHQITIGYRIDGEIYSDVIPVTFYREGLTGGDIVVEDTSVPVDGARTIGLHLENLNKGNRPIDRLALEVSDGVEILAVGPTADPSIALLELGRTEGGRAVVGENVSDVRIQLEPGETLLPIYVTVRGGDASSAISYTTIDAEGNVISEGTLQIPSSVNENDDDITAGGIIMESYPNPTNATSTLELYMPSTSQQVELTIVDATGRVVKRLLEDARLTGGTHLFVVDTSTLPNGSYLYTIRTEIGTETHTVRIVR